MTINIKINQKELKKILLEEINEYVKEILGDYIKEIIDDDDALQDMMRKEAKRGVQNYKKNSQGASNDN